MLYKAINKKTGVAGDKLLTEAEKESYEKERLTKGKFKFEQVNEPASKAPDPKEAKQLPMAEAKG